MRKIILPLLTGVLLTSCVWGGSTKTEDFRTDSNIGLIITPTQAEEILQPRTIKLIDLNKSGQLGAAVLEAVGEKTKVTISLVGKKNTEPQPAHIHLGSCPKPDQVKYALNDVINGKSETIVETKMSEIVNSLPLAINVHLSVAEASVITSCGDIQ